MKECFPQKASPTNERYDFRITGPTGRRLASVFN